MNNVKLFFFILMVVVLVIILPLVTIWAVNTLFGLGIEYTIWTWLASTWLSAVFGGGQLYKKR